MVGVASGAVWGTWNRVVGLAASSLAELRGQRAGRPCASELAADVARPDSLHRFVRASGYKISMKKERKTFDKVATLCETAPVIEMNSTTKQNRRNYENETDHQPQRIPRLHILLARRGRKPRRPRATLGISSQKAQAQGLRMQRLQMRGITARGLRNPRTVDQRQPGVSDHPGNRDGNRSARELSSAVRRESLKLQESDRRRMVLRIARGEAQTLG